MQLGEWKRNRFLGERIEYRADRIYGIDISRFQHEKGRKRYAIDWKRVRITNLGKLSRKRIAGAVDYPVSFCYIKSTEGTTIKNRYFRTDYAAARAQGIKCGAYHFFSTRTPGAKQARHFLKYSTFRKGDLPPVLDVEPTPECTTDENAAVSASTRADSVAEPKSVGESSVVVRRGSDTTETRSPAV